MIVLQKNDVGLLELGYRKSNLMKKRERDRNSVIIFGLFLLVFEEGILEVF